jgi:hypothetical protein
MSFSHRCHVLNNAEYFLEALPGERGGIPGKLAEMLYNRFGERGLVISVPRI